MDIVYRSYVTDLILKGYSNNYITKLVDVAVEDVEQVRHQVNKQLSKGVFDYVE